MNGKKRFFVTGFGVLFLMALFLCARAGLAASPEAKPEEGETVICYHETAGFIVSAPKGWVNDAEAASHLGICALYIPQGTSYNDAPAVIYPKAGTRGTDGSLHDTAKALAELGQKMLSSRPGGENLRLRQGKDIKTEGGETFALWYFDQGPPPNEWEAVAYLPKNTDVLLLVLSTRLEAAREAHMKDLEAVAHAVSTLDVEIEGKK